MHNVKDRCAQSSAQSEKNIQHSSATYHDQKPANKFAKSHYWEK